MNAEADFDAMARNMTARAATLAAAWLANRHLAARQDETRWRRGGLIWPLFAKG